MIVVKTNDLPRQDNLFDDGEPDWRYNRRCIRLEADNYVLQNNESDVTDDFPEMVAPVPMIKKSYIEKERDGKQYFEDKRAELVLLYQTGNLTEANLYEIEDEYEKIFKSLRRGDWKSAQNKLSSITVGGAITQSFADQIETEINDYVTNNY